MQTPRLPSALRILGRAVLLLFFSTGAFRAQTVPPPRTDAAAEEPLVLSPFQVNVTHDTEYLATESLGGTRFKSSLRDIPAQVSVMTAEFLEDIAVTTLEDSLRYSLNVESAFDAMDVTNPATAGQELGNNPLSGGRTRGMGSSNRSHDFFGTSLPLDTYNTERFTFSSGPNAILFGNSSPTGTIDTTFKRARLERAARTLTLRVDSNESLRSGFELNQPLIPRKAGLLVAALREKAVDFREPAYERQERFYATGTVRPFQPVTIRGWYETQSRFRQPGRNTLLQDKVTPWIAAGRPLFNNALPALGGPNSLPGGIATAPTASNYSPVFASYQYGTRPIFVFDHNGSALPTTLWARSVQTRGYDTLRASPDNRDTSLSDPSIFPLDTAISGNGLQNYTRGWIAGGIVELNPLRHLFIELGGNTERFNYKNVDYINNDNSDLWVDANRYAPDGVTPNPYVGRYYLENNPKGVKRRAEQEEFRASVSYELDLARQRTDWRKWLGRHRFAGLASWRQSKSASQSQDLRVVSSHAFTTGAANNTLNETGRQINLRNYLADPANPAAGGSYYLNLPFNPFHPGTIPGTDLTLAFIDNPAGATATTEGTRTTVDSRVLAMQNYFLKDRIVATWGWRVDDVAVDNISAANIGGAPRTGTGSSAGHVPMDEFLRYGDRIWSRATDDQPGTRLRGVVVHPLRWVSLHYNESNTDSSPGYSRRAIDGSPASLADGLGRDYGFSVRFFSGALSLRFNRYMNTSSGELSAYRASTPTSTGQSSNFLRDNVFHLERTVLRDGAPYSERFRAFEDAVMRTPAGASQNVDRSDFDVLSDKVARGDELQIAGRINPQWSVAVSAARNETRESNIGKGYFDLIAERLPVWAGYLGSPLHVNPAVSVGQYLPRAIQNWNFIRLSEGRPNFQESKYRLNFTTRYAFNEGALRGLFVGGNYLWRNRPKVGFTEITISDNPFVVPGVSAASIVVTDRNNPIFGTEIRSIDAFAGYTFRRLFAGKVSWRLQLNVRNLFDDDDLVVQQALSTGQGAIYRLQTPRTFILTNVFTF